MGAGLHPVALTSLPTLGPRPGRLASHARGLKSGVAAMATQEPRDFADPSASDFAVAIMGDLHLPSNAADMGLFLEARDQLVGMARQDSAAARLVQLGDLGSYERGWPGSAACFARAGDFLTGFNLPTGLILGNHDLEGDDFDTDEANLAAWQEAFQQRHFWSARLGPALLIGLSTTRFRSNPYSVHEVHVDDEQLAFFEAALKEAGDRPVIVFSHAPILGSGLKVVQAVHVKNRCAWLNHSSNPQRFMQLVQAHPNIKLWMSGHFHLSQNYPDSISLVGGTAFVLTGVIGDSSSRDGLRHSRLLRGNAEGFELYTVDHDDASTRLDLRGRWSDPGPPEFLVPEADFLCDPASGWLCSEVDCSLDLADGCPAPAAPPQMKWLNAGPGSMLALQDDIIVEYDVQTMAPIGAVCLGVEEGSRVRLVDAAGAEVDAVHGDGANAVALEVLDPGNGEVVQRVERNQQGGFFVVFQPNKWRLRKAKEAAEAAAASKEAVGAA